MVEDNQQKLISELQTRVEALEDCKSFEANKFEVQKVQMEMLSQLRVLREAMGRESSTGHKAGSKGVTEMNALREANEVLRKQNAKQAYRIKHLVRAVHEMQEQK